MLEPVSAQTFIFGVSGLSSNILILPEFNLYEALKIEDPKKVEWKEHLIDLRGRDLRRAILAGSVLPKADLRSAQLQGASLDGAELQGAKLDGAQLQGAKLDRAQLQGASLGKAQLQGASLDNAQLQGASLKDAQLQGAVLDKAQLQAASLDKARLQGASLKDAQLDGASLKDAQLQGASLKDAQLQGASLKDAQLQGANLDKGQLQGASLEGAFLWRAQLDKSRAGNIFWGNDVPNWTPEYSLKPIVGTEPWTDVTYAELQQFIEHEVPEDWMRAKALERIAILDCAQNTWQGRPIASCDRSAEPPETVKQWRKMIRAASIDQAAYAGALAEILGDLICSVEPYRAEVLRGLLHSDRVKQTGSEMPVLTERITKECPIAAGLTDPDRRALLEATEEAVSFAKPP